MGDSDWGRSRNDASGAGKPAKGLLRRMALAVLRWSGVPFIIRETVQRRRVTILYHHNVDPHTLDLQLSALEKRYSFVSLRDCVSAMAAGRLDLLPAKPLVVTLDDGYRENFELLDVFRRHAVRPTIFLCSGMVDTGRTFWWSGISDVGFVEHLKRIPDSARVKALAEAGLISEAASGARESLSGMEIDRMRDVVDFQAHTISHPILTRCDDESAWREIEGCMASLKEAHGLDIYALAYPNGDYSNREVEFLKKAGYTCAVSTKPGLNGAKANLFGLSRVHLPTDASETAVIVRACVIPVYLRHAWLRFGTKDINRGGSPLGSPTCARSESLQTMPATLEREPVSCPLGKNGLK